MQKSGHERPTVSRIKRGLVRHYSEIVESRPQFIRIWFAALVMGAAGLTSPASAEPNWSGLYVGVGLGMRSTQTDTSVTSVVNNGVNDYPATCAFLAQLGPAYGGCVPAQPLNDTGFRVSSYVGLNWEIMPRWIVGIEADLGLSDRSTTLSGMRYPGTTLYTGVRADQFTVSTKWDASARGRVGFLVNPSILVYATGGPAWLRLKSSSSCDISANAACSPVAGSGPPLIRNSATKLGWTVGGGIEAMLLSNWILRGEYRYADFGTISPTDQRYPLGGGIKQVVSYDLDVKTHTATLGLAYKFGGDQGAASSRTLQPHPSLRPPGAGFISAPDLACAQVGRTQA